jgi:hypothetical protein
MSTDLRDEYEALRAEVARLEAELSKAVAERDEAILEAAAGYVEAIEHPDVVAICNAAEAENERLTAERDRLARVLAVERGDATAAPEGWSGPYNDWYRGNDDGTGLFCTTCWTGRGRHKWAVYVDGELVADGVAATALEAMEAADAAAGEPTP